MLKNRRITLHQNIGKGIKFNYITSKNTVQNVSGIQNVTIYVGIVGNSARADCNFLRIYDRAHTARGSCNNTLLRRILEGSL